MNMPREDKLSLILQELVRRTNEESRRLRNLEQKFRAQELRTKTLEDSSIERSKKINEKIIEMDALIKSQNDNIMKMKAIVDKLVKQSEKFARKSEIKEIEKMLDLISPLAQQFVTKKELEELKRKPF